MGHWPRPVSFALQALKVAGRRAMSAATARHLGRRRQRTVSLPGLLALGLLTAVPISLASAAQPAVASATAEATHPPPLNPIAAARYLAEQRAGFGPPARAAALAAKAEARARTLRSRPLRSGPATSPRGQMLSPSRPMSSPSVAVPNFAADWSSLGPAPITQSFYGGNNSGRVDSAAVVQSGPNAGEIFIGTAGGGVWSSADNGATWASHTGQVATGLAIGALAIDPASPSIIYAGTGEANNCGDCFYGGGVLKSTDGGSTWTVENPGGIFTGADFASIAVDPNNDQDLYATTTKGFYVSTDGGTTWSHPSGTGNFTSPSWGLALDPTTSPTTVYIATFGVGIQKSTDGGTNFTTLGGGLPSANSFEVASLGIGSGSTGHQTLYAANWCDPMSNANCHPNPNGGQVSMYKTTDGGSSWNLLTTPAYTNQSYAYGGGSADQGGYDNALAVDPANPSHVIALGIAAIETTDGGTTWSNINGQSFFGSGTNVLHPDFHAAAFTASGNVILGCDGGVYEYSGGGPGGVSDLNTDQVTTQFYEDLGVYGNGSQVLGGLQDNGTALYGGSSSWPQERGGDGGYSAINPIDHSQQFGEADQDLFETTDSWGPSTNDITPPADLRHANFVPPMTIVPNASLADSPTVYYGAGDLWMTTIPASGPPTWSRVTSVGAGVSAIAVAPSNPSVVYVGFDNGTLEVSTNGGSTFTGISPGVGQWITHIDVDPSNPGSIAVTFSDNNTQYQSVPPMVDTGAVTLTGTPAATYTDITGNLPTGVASNSVVHDGSALVVATDVGVFSTTAPNGSSTVWAAVGTGLPNVQVIGLSVDKNGILYAATHGRGVWKLPGTTTTSSVSAPAGDTTGTAIAASSISASLSGATSDASGTITFTVFGPQASPPADCTSGGTSVGTATVSGDGTYNPSAGFTPGSAGTYWWYATYSGDADNTASDSGCGAGMTSTVVVNPPDLSISNSAPTSVVSGQALTYTITATNTGGQAATGVTVTDSLPASVHFDSMSTSQGTCARSPSGTPKTKDGTVTCGLDMLSAGDSMTVTIVVTTTTPGTISDPAAVTASNVTQDTDDSVTAATTVLGT